MFWLEILSRIIEEYFITRFFVIQFQSYILILHVTITKKIAITSARYYNLRNCCNNLLQWTNKILSHTFF